MADLLFSVLLQGLKLWNTKESSKYIDELYELRKDWTEEYDKPRNQRSNAKLDDIESRLHLLGRIFIDSTGKEKV